jgi:hypothetical protein
MMVAGKNGTAQFLVPPYNAILGRHGMGLALDLIEAFVRCRYKAFLKYTGQTGSPTEYELLESKLVDG